jgi:hypothetical protein
VRLVKQVDNDTDEMFCNCGRYLDKDGTQPCLSSDTSLPMKHVFFLPILGWSGYYVEHAKGINNPFVGSLPGTAPDVKPNVFQHTAICFLNASCEHGEALVERYSNGLGRECHKDPGTKWQCIITIL